MGYLGGFLVTLRQHRLFLANALPQTQKDSSALLCCRLRPGTGVEGFARGSDGALHVAGIGLGNFREDLFRRGIEDRKPRPVLAVHKLAVDVHPITLHESPPGAPDLAPSGIR